MVLATRLIGWACFAAGVVLVVGFRLYIPAYIAMGVGVTFTLASTILRFLRQRRRTQERIDDLIGH